MRVAYDAAGEHAGKLLEQDPRPAYKNEPDRIYGMNYKGYEIRFKTADGKVTVIEVKEIKRHE